MREFAPHAPLPGTEIACADQPGDPDQPGAERGSGRGGRGSASASATCESTRVSRPAGLGPTDGLARPSGSPGPPAARRSGRTSAPGGRRCASASSSAAIRADRPLIASATGSGRWIQSASGPSGLRPSTRTGWPGFPTTVEFGGTSWITTRVGADLGAVADRDRPEQLGARADRHVVLDRRVALAGRKARAAERHALIERHVVADLGRLADHDAHPVVDEEAVADLRRRVDLDPGDRAGRRRQSAAAAAAHRHRAARARRDGPAGRGLRARSTSTSSEPTSRAAGSRLGPQKRRARSPRPCAGSGRARTSTKA